MSDIALTRYDDVYTVGDPAGVYDRELIDKFLGGVYVEGSPEDEAVTFLLAIMNEGMVNQDGDKVGYYE